MASDPITAEIRAIRHQLAAQCGNDVSRILADVRQREASDGMTYLTLPKRSVRVELAEQSMALKPPKPRVANGQSAPAAG